ncbi:MAG: hypothetical protein ACI9XO_000459 [Paraglaciecola sp.]|jgi:hypothetical protein
MSLPTMRRPEKSEYNPYYDTYIKLIPTDDILNQLTSTRETTTAYLKSIPTEKWDFRYAPGKWSLKESWIHVLDTERIFACRALRISRGDMTALAGFDQNEYVPFYNAENRSEESIIEEYETVRASTINLLKNLDAEALKRIGTASDSPVSVRALAFMIGGHELHHLNITEERYLK